jgi:hypothetical protein
MFYAGILPSGKELLHAATNENQFFIKKSAVFAAVPWILDASEITPPSPVWTLSFL